MSDLGPLRVVALVARREFLARALARSYLISNALVLSLVVLGTVGASFLGGGDDRVEVGLVGKAQELAGRLVESGEAAGLAVVPVQVADEPTARRGVAEDLTVALLPAEGQGVIALTEA
jgi:ABC-2 type transport system permease protein